LKSFINNINKIEEVSIFLQFQREGNEMDEVVVRKQLGEDGEMRCGRASGEV